MTGQALEIFIGALLLVFGAVVTAVVQALFRRNESTGKRIGALEKSHDFERGRRAARAEMLRELKAKGHVK